MTVDADVNVDIPTDGVDRATIDQNVVGYNIDSEPTFRSGGPLSVASRETALSLGWARGRLRRR